MRPTRRFIGRLIACMAAMFVTAASHANLIVNGTFDDEVPQNGTGGGWTSGNNDFGGGWQSGFGNPAPSFRMNQAGQLATDPFIEQTVSGLSVGTLYLLSGDYALRFALGNPNNSFEVRLDGVPILSTGPAAPSGTFAPFSTSFIAAASSHTIQFAAEANGSDHDYNIDNIVLVVIPEPATIALAAISFLGLTAGGRRSQHRVRRIRRPNHR